MRVAGFLCIAAALVPGCSRTRGGDSGPFATIAITVSGGVLNGNVAVGYSLSGTGTWDATFSYSTDGGVTWSGASPANGCPTTKSLPAGMAYTFSWDTVADAVTGPALVRGSIAVSSATAPCTIGNAGLVFLDTSATIDAAIPSIVFPPVHRGHYDLGPTVLNFLADPVLAPLVQQVPVKSWRISVGRWEIGPVSIMAPEPACYSTDPNQLKSCSREFYTGPNTLAGAVDPLNYNFGYLDSAIAAVEAFGAEPYLCFDYTPFNLASNQDPLTANNHYLGDPNLSFSNGIRTSPPLDNAVYAEVVKRVVMHVKGSFASGLNKPLTHVEIGNEPDLPFTYFWTGTRAQFIAMYMAVAGALDLQFGASIRIGAASFAWLPGEADPTFLEDFLVGIGATRLDFVGIHAYQDDPTSQIAPQLAKAKLLRDTHKPLAELHVPEWGMVLDGGPEFDDMTAALHHARALEYFLLFDVQLSHRALVRDIVPGAGGLGLLKAGPAATKPATYVFHAHERLSQTPLGLSIPAQVPAGKPMILAGSSATAITILFFHEAPPVGQVGRFTLTLANNPFPNYAVDRYRLTDATCANGDGLWLQQSRDLSGPFGDTILFTDDVLVMWRLTLK
jgi:hypothetical protein